MLSFAIEPPLGTSISVQGGSQLLVRAVVAWTSSSSSSSSGLSVELWTNVDSAGESEWRAVAMQRETAALRLGVRRHLEEHRGEQRGEEQNLEEEHREEHRAVFAAALRIPASRAPFAFEYTARIVAFDACAGCELVAFAEGAATTRVCVNACPHSATHSATHSAAQTVKAWLTRARNAAVHVSVLPRAPNSVTALFAHVDASVTLHDLPLDFGQRPSSAGIRLAGSISSESLDAVFLQRVSPQTSSFTLNRRNQHWLEPGYGFSGWPESSLSREVYLASWNIQTQFDSAAENQPLFVVLIPTPPHVFQMKENGNFSITATPSAHLWPHDYKSNPVRAFLAVSTDPVSAVQFLMRLMRKTTPAPAATVSIETDDCTSEISSTSTLHEMTVAPSRFYDRLGWCTWNSFYRDVSEAGIEAGLLNFKESGIKINWLLIDDGWQIVDSALKFQAFGLNSKFPSGYSLIRKLKHEHNLSHIGVWHSLVGYWGGIHPTGEIAAHYKLQEITQRGLTEPTSSATLVVDSVSYSQYYNDFHKLLKDSGIDFFKVDDQSVFEAFTEANNPGQLLQKYQETLIQESKTTPLIWCMSHNMQVLYQTLLHSSVSSLSSSTSAPSSYSKTSTHKKTMRSSDDFYPDDPNSHTWHIQSNAFNSLLVGNLSPSTTLMDWDMFQSSHAYAEFHAISRALSNGPVYLSDVLGTHNAEVVAPLLADDGRVIRVSDSVGGGEDTIAAMPVPKSLLTDIGGGNGLLFVEAHGGGSGCAVVGVFNCARSSDTKKSVSDLIAPTRDLVRSSAQWMTRRNSNKLAARWYKSGQVMLLDDSMDSLVMVELAEREADVLTVCPMWKSKSGMLIACFGLHDKYYGAAAVKSIEYEDVSAGGVRVRLDAAFSGTYAFYSVLPDGTVQSHVVECQEGLKKWYL
ncbi:raffinose synthase or seed imbibition protein Sip1-domain-containing protein [Obelidium mucronatum]|nr:raffinose synthase or seed imbibition protein Sip1-domain-containing protein [Obelidium mucronatum]